MTATLGFCCILYTKIEAQLLVRAGLLLETSDLGEGVRVYTSTGTEYEGSARVVVLSCHNIVTPTVGSSDYNSVLCVRDNLLGVRVDLSKGSLRVLGEVCSYTSNSVTNV